MRRIAVIPAYEPDGKMIDVVREAVKKGFDTIVVDDGSGDRYGELFRLAGECAHVISYPDNWGKGHAMKTAFKYIEANYIWPYVVVVIDCDGQHKVDDAERLCRETEREQDTLVLGRRQQSPDSPARSRFGNWLTRRIYRLAAGIDIYDTQTGMRAFSSELISRMLKVKGERYEYEMNMLLDLAEAGVPIVEVPIETIYIDNNSGSHFRAVRDSVRIYKELFRFSVSSFAGFLTDYGVFSLLTWIMGSGSVAASNILARVVSASVNFSLNRRFVFRSREPLAKSAVKYALLALFILGCNTGLLCVLSSWLGMNPYAAKILVEISLFFVSWAVQKKFVFGKKGRLIERKTETLEGYSDGCDK